MATRLWLALIVLPWLATSYDPSLSNGTCYFGANKVAADTFIPCGNAAGGVQSCCQARDICLSSNACFNGQYFVTYLAGCTDPRYADSACPFKGQFSSQQWVGLVRCGVSSSVGEEWGPCEERDQPKLNKGNQTCRCDASQKTAVFTDAATLTNIASLPVSAGNAVAWYSGFQPSTTISASVTNPVVTITSIFSSGISVSATASATSQPDAEQSKSLSPAATAGIGVGAAVSAVAVVCLLLWLFWHRRRKSKAVASVDEHKRQSTISPWGLEDSIGSVIEDSKTWGRRSELPTDANEITTTKTSLGDNTIRSSINTPAHGYQPYLNSPMGQTSEMDGSPAASTSGLALNKPAYEKPVYGGPVYEMPG